MLSRPPGNDGSMHRMRSVRRRGDTRITKMYQATFDQHSFVVREPCGRDDVVYPRDRRGDRPPPFGIGLTCSEIGEDLDYPCEDPRMID